MFRRLFKKHFSKWSPELTLLIALRREVESKNIAYPFDDRDVGYDMAIDEVLELIDQAIYNTSNNNDVDYSGGL